MTTNAAELPGRPFTSESARAAVKARHERARQRKENEQREADERKQTQRERLRELAYDRLEQVLADDQIGAEKWLVAAKEALDRIEGKAVARIETASETVGIREQLAKLTRGQRAELERRLIEKSRRALVEISAAENEHPDLAVIEGEVVSQSPPETVDHDDHSQEPCD